MLRPAVAGVLAVAGTLAIPDLGLVLAGPLAAGLAGLGAGAATGGIVFGVRPHSAEDSRYFQEMWGTPGGDRLPPEIH